MYSLEYDYAPEKKGWFVTKPICFLISLIILGTLAALIALAVLYGQKQGCKVVPDKELPTSLPFTGNPVTVTTLSPPKTTQEPENIPNYRLPRSFKPIHYNIKIGSALEEPNLEFNGNVQINIKCLESSSLIIIHSKGLQINYNKIILKNQTGNEIKPKHITADNVTDFLSINFHENLQTGENYELIIGEFNGSLIQSDLRGFYRSSYMIDGKIRNLAATQFEATHARKAFPCFDEPEWKATFNITIVRPKSMTSLCNTELISTEVHEDLEADHYAETVRMSPYLVAFTISDFKNSSEKYTHFNDKTRTMKFSSHARFNAVHQVEYSLEVGVKLLKYFEEKFKSDYQLSKLDMIALPDFDAGAMENWGLITYRETALLYDIRTSSAVNKKRVAIVVAHEILHQWFGNLVTCVWWNQIWLNEGFARYFQFEATDKAEPDWKIKDHFFLDDMQDVFEVDALENTHPLYQDVSTPSEIWSLFDKISYGKGAWLIRMMESFLGTDNLYKGLVNYLENNKYDVVDQEKLFKELTLAVENDTVRQRDVNLTMSSWTFEKGYPIITAIRNYENGSISLKQERFLLLPNINEDQKSPIWHIYIEYKSEKQDKKGLWFIKDTEVVYNITNIDTEESKEWLLLNVGMNGMYRVNYDEENWKRLANQLKANNQVIMPINRAQILEDALTFSRIGLMNYTTSLGIVEYLKNETEYVPWAAGRRGLNFLKDILSSTTHYGEFQKMMKRLIEKLYNEVKENLKVEQLSFAEEYRTSLAVNVACENENSDCLDEMNHLYKDPYSIPAYLYGLVYCNSVRYGSEQIWQNVFNLYKYTSIASNKVSLLLSLSCSQDTTILNRLMNMASEENEDIKSQDVRYVFAGVTRTEIGRYEFWKFLQEHWKQLKSHFKFALSSAISQGVNTWVASASSEQSLDELQEFMKKNDEDLQESQTLKNTFKSALAKLKLNVNWRKKYLKDVLNWYDNFNK